MSGDRVCKTEIYDADVLQALLIHPGVCKDDKNLLRRYKKRKVNGNTVPTIYDYATKWRGIKKGRMYPDPHVGLTVFERQIRSALAEKFYWDIDIANAQPVLLEYEAKRRGLKTDALSEYIANRQTILNEIMTKYNMTRAEAKDICIATVFGGRRNEHPVLIPMYDELQNLAKIIQVENPDICNVAIKTKSKNVTATCLAIYIQDIERQILCAIDSYLQLNGRGFEVLMFDGGFVRKADNEKQFPTYILRNVEKHICDTFGVEITLEQKPLEHTFEFKTDKLTDASIIINDSFAAEKFVEMAGDYIIQSGDIYTYDEEADRWITGEDGVRKLIHRFRHQLVWRQQGPLNIIIYDYGGKEKNVVQMMKYIKNFVPHGNIPIKYEYTYEDDNSGIRSSVLQVLDELFDLISDGLKPHRDYLIKYIADIFQNPLVLPGVMLILSGEQGCGKDTLFDYVIKALGSAYAMNYGSSSTQYFDKHDMGRMNRFMVKLEEADRKMCLKHSEVLKGHVTSVTQVFNPKGQRSIDGVKNSCRIIFTTNSELPV